MKQSASVTSDTLGCPYFDIGMTKNRNERMTLVKGLSFLKGTDSNSLSLYFVYNCQLNCSVHMKMVSAPLRTPNVSAVSDKDAC